MHSGTWRSVALCFTAAVWLLATGPAAAQCPAWSPPTTMEPLNAGTQSFAIFHNRLIITGGFTSIGGVATGGPVAFDGSTFTPMTLGRVGGGGGQLAVHQSQLYITGGIAGTAGQIWSGSSWVTWPGTGTLTGSTQIARSIHGAPSLGVFAEGGFVFPGGVIVRHAFWESGAWRPASTQWGPNVEGNNAFANVRDVEEYEGFLYVAGDFASIARGSAFNQNTVQSQGACIYDGSQWFPMPRGGLNGTVRDMVIFQDQLYLAGDFTATRDAAITLNRVARFDGTNYFPVGTGSGVAISSLCVADDGTGEKLFLTASTGALLRSDGGTPAFLPTLFGSPLISAAFDPGFGMKVYVGGSGLRTNLQTQNGSGLIAWGPATTSTIDTDGDGLPDSWEINGIDGDCNGTIDLNLAALGANPNHKDLFVEVDSMQGRAPLAGVMASVQAAFANAPVSNPDGVQGINLRIIQDAGDQTSHCRTFH
ncbi:MAG: hypothetical protein KGS45_02410 [Planctomycetes bacterium]|nr:hypothetical protein [Planctomycetota bacterium]